ncbi:MAG: arsenosugar biosynthesis radical SAM protein ArsS, partial [Candidatus Omnitrophica bacterium]|nr:arsenosugar biosynthesis radical SAM protein ArsS [Candidatus Omnitrophota bacterium]
MNAFLSIMEEPGLKRTKLTTLQVNMGNFCNQRCAHCHVEASPEGKHIMSREVIDTILRFLRRNPGLVLDITGGAPELNPHFASFLANARPLAAEIIVRSNLTVIFEPGMEQVPELYRSNRVHLVCSLPCYGRETVDTQRGEGTFARSIRALRLLNDKGYAVGEELKLDLVYNPLGATLPPEQSVLQEEYKEHLRRDYGVVFNNLMTITNVPIKRFKEYLDQRGNYEEYLRLLKDNFNSDAASRVMCREFLSVGYDGRLYDCDFNQSLCRVMKDSNGTLLTLDSVNTRDLMMRDIAVGEHCLSCTAGFGSSCHGALLEEGVKTFTEEACCGSHRKSVREAVRDYYGNTLQATADLKTGACCPNETLPSEHKKILKLIHPEILERFYGCGSPIPPLLKGCTVLDLGCGTGRDVYVASALAGEKGRVIGVDMTEEQLAVARKHLAHQMGVFGYRHPTVSFRKGYIEDLKAIDIRDNSVDVAISNCVINLSAEKGSVFAELFRILKPGGELYFSDVFTGRRMPLEHINDPVLRGECLGGALYIEDFRRLLLGLGIRDYRVVSRRRIDLRSPEIERKVGGVDFYSMTVRCFKLDLEDIREDYGQTAVYLGTIPSHAHSFTLDDYHTFITGK